jgi:SAM-dependent methyltransferase
MAHEAQRVFVQNLKSHFSEFFDNKKVLEIGSLNINGTVRDFFKECNYLGIDVGEGHGVDLVCPGQEFNAPDESYDTVLSTECFEHNPYWLETFKNMIRMCKDGGLIFFTCATDGRAEHGTTRSDSGSSPLTIDLGWDYYRNLNESDFTSNLNFDDLFSSYQFIVNSDAKDLYFWGIKKKISKQPIPVIGTLIVNGVHWLKRLIDSVDYPVNEFVIFNNNGRDQITKELDELTEIAHPHIKKIRVCHLPSNIGCPGGWNMIIKSYMMAPYWIIVNNDVAFTPGFLNAMVDKASENDVGMVHSKFGESLSFKDEVGSFECFLIKDWVIQSHGLFDENLYPVYCEDVDYEMRIRLKPFKRVAVDLPYLHGDTNAYDSGSQTLKVEPELKEKINMSRILNETEYLANKWGKEYWTEGATVYDKPFNKELPITITTYDLEFVRKKNLGF